MGGHGLDLCDPEADPREHGNESSGSIKGVEFLDREAISFSRRNLLHGDSSTLLYTNRRFDACEL
jgi:hypothetical protein